MLAKPYFQTNREFIAFENWLNHIGGYVHRARLVNQQNHERGIYATEKIYAGDPIIYVPNDALLTDDVAQKSCIGQVVDAANIEALSKQSIVACYILQENFHSKYCQTSDWQYYLSMLPKSFDEIPLHFCHEQLEKIQGSHIVEMTLKKKAAIDHEYGLLCQHIPEFGRYSFSEYLWARTAISSRCFSIHHLPNASIAMVPFADMLNHRTTPNARWGSAEDGSGFMVQAVRDIAVSEEITICYGDKSSSRFFSSYGFCPNNPKADENRIDVVLNPSDPQYSVRKTAWNGLHQQTFTIRFEWNHEFQSMLSAFRIATQPALSKQNIECIQNGKLMSINSEFRMLLALKKACTQTLLQYPVTDKTDRQTNLPMESVIHPFDMTTGSSHSMALAIKNEKKVLENVIRFSQAAINWLQREYRLDPYYCEKKYELKALQDELLYQYQIDVKHQLPNTKRNHLNVCQQAPISHAKNHHRKPSVSLSDVTAAMWKKLFLLDVHSDQKHFIPSMNKIYADTTFRSTSHPAFESECQAVGIWENNVLVGLFTYLWVDKHTIWFGGFQISAQKQASGIGKQAFLMFLNELLAVEHFHAIGLDVVEANIHAMRFYQRLGFSLTSYNPDGAFSKWNMNMSRKKIQKLLNINGYSNTEVQN